MSPQSIITLHQVKMSISCCPLTSTSINTFVLNCAWSLHISLLIQMRNQYYGSQFKGINILMEFFFLQKHTFWPHKKLIYELEWCVLLWCFYQLFGLSFWRHPFTAEDPLLSKWCNARFLQICSDEQTKSSTSWMTWWSNFCKNFIFGGTIPKYTLEGF